MNYLWKLPSSKRVSETKTKTKKIENFIYIFHLENTANFFLTFTFSYSRVAMPCCRGWWYCNNCYQVCSFMGWLVVISTVFLQVFLFMITLGPNKLSLYLTFSLYLVTDIQMPFLHYCSCSFEAVVSYSIYNCSPMRLRILLNYDINMKISDYFRIIL